MGIFDFFAEEEKKKPGKAAAGNTVGAREPTGIGTNFFHPKSISDVATIIDAFKHGSSAVVYLSELTKADAQRVLDYLAGAVFALDGSVTPVGDDVYFFTLEGVKIVK